MTSENFKSLVSSRYLVHVDLLTSCFLVTLLKQTASRTTPEGFLMSCLASLQLILYLKHCRKHSRIVVTKARLC